jgi:hypothetical protein
MGPSRGGALVCHRGRALILCLEFLDRGWFPARELRVKSYRKEGEDR